MRGITLSGWGQPHDALLSLFPYASAIDYADYTTVQETLAHIEQQARGCDWAIGWSLGGQMLVRAIATGMVKMRFLILIATPFQFVATPHDALGMKRDLYDKFRDNYARHPERTLTKAWELVAKGDSNANGIRNYLSQQDKQKILQKNWLQWLTLLDGFTCDALDFSQFPSTLLLHGDQDAVASIEQSQRLAQRLPQAQLINYPTCGHAPHWHDTQSVMHTIQKYLYA